MIDANETNDAAATPRAAEQAASPGDEVSAPRLDAGDADRGGHRPTGGQVPLRLPPAAISLDDLLTIGQVAAAIPSRPTVAAVYRWIHHGVRKPAGRGARIYLEAVRFGGRYLVRRGHLHAFLTATNAIRPDLTAAPKAAGRTGPTRRSKAVTMRRLEARLGPRETWGA